MKTSKLFLSAILVFFLVMFYSASVIAQPDLPIGILRLKEYERNLSESVTYFLAFFAGLISITSPCGFAILPTFFSFAFLDRKRSMAMTTAFSIGLLAAFTVFGIIAGMLGNFFNGYKLGFAVVSGYFLIAFGILMFLNTGISVFNFKLDYGYAKSLFSSLMLGFFFGVGWTPCAGPILVGILVLAANSATALKGALMLIFYGIGIVAPLLVMAYFSDRYDFSNSKFLRGKLITIKIFGRKFITHTYNIIGGILLTAIGALMVYYEGTFFFQTDLPRVIPWSMSMLGYLNEKSLESGIFTSAAGNVLGIVLVLIIIFLVVFNLKNAKKGKSDES